MKRYVLATAAFICSAAPAAANVCEAEMGRASVQYGVPLGVQGTFAGVGDLVE